MKRIILLSLISLTTFFTAYTQNSIDYFLVDSLEYSAISDYDKSNIEAHLKKYHAAKNDTAKLAILESLIDNCYDDHVWPLYNWYLLDKSIELKNKSTDKELIAIYRGFEAVAYGNGGYLEDLKGNVEKAEEFYWKAYNLFIENNDLAKQGQILNSISLLRFNAGDYSNGIKYLEQSLEKVYQDKDLQAILYGHINLAGHLGDMGDSDGAIGNYLEALEYALIIKDSNTLVHIYSSLARAYTWLDSSALAKEYTMAGIEIAEHTGNAKGQAVLLGNLGWFALEEKNYDACRKYTFEQLRLSEQVEYIDQKIGAYVHLSRLYEDMNILDSAIYFANLSISNSNGNIDLNKERISLGVLMRSYEQLNQKDSLIKYSKQFYLAEEKFYKSENQRELLKQTAKINYDKQKELDDLAYQQSIAVERAQKERSQLLLYGSIFIIVLLVVGTTLILKQSRINKKQSLELADAYKQLEISKKNELITSNLKALQSQMNPHFIFNALNSVQDLVLLQDIRNSNKYLGKFSDLIRMILQSSRKQFISLQEEIQMLQLYLDLEQLRFGDSLETDINTSISTDQQEDIKVPAMFVQPFVENALKHGLFSKKGDKKVVVSFELNKTTLVCTITDNGIGSEKAKRAKATQPKLHAGFSTSAIEERVYLLNQSLKTPILLTQGDIIESDEVLGYQVIIQFPVDINV